MVKDFCFNQARVASISSPAKASPSPTGTKGAHGRHQNLIALLGDQRIGKLHRRRREIPRRAGSRFLYHALLGELLSFKSQLMIKTRRRRSRVANAPGVIRVTLDQNPGRGPATVRPPWEPEVLMPAWVERSD